MRKKAELWQTYRGTTQNQREKFETQKICPVGFETGDGKCNVLA
jgi:hypothetical protein